jgi:nitroreductase
MTGVKEALRSRFSCRRFLPKDVPRATIESILTTAQMTPSWCNTQPWQNILLSGQAVNHLADKLYAHAASGARAQPDFAFPTRYEGIYRDRRKVCGVQLYQSLGIGKDERDKAAEQALENFRFFGAPHVLLISTSDALGTYGAVDCGLYVCAFILAAREHGVDSIAQAAIASYPDVLRDHFDVGPDRKFLCAIPFGYADGAHPANAYRTERADLADVVDWRD